MTDRDHLDRGAIAACLLNGLLSNPKYLGAFPEGEPPWDEMAREAVRATDALLRALEDHTHD